LYLPTFADPLPKRGVGRMAAEASKIGLPLYKKIPVQAGLDTEQPLWVGECEKPAKVQTRPARV